MKHLRWYPELIALIAGAAITRFWSLFFPNAVVFDEVYFKAFAAHYLDGKYYFDIHPPLGKLLLAAFSHFYGLSATSMLGGTAVGLRVLPALAGLLLVPLMWGILRRLGASRPLAFLGALAVMLDNAILTESRFILTDSMLLLFGLGAVYLYLVARTAKTNWHWVWLSLAAVSAGAAASIKWTGINAIAVIGLFWIWDQLRSKLSWPRRLAGLAILVILPISVYLSSFWLHFQLLPNSGDGDAFMSTTFQSTLKGSPHFDPQAHLSFFSKFFQLNAEMYHANETLTATHPYGSRWYTWPLEQRGIYYWEGQELSSGRQGNIYLLGNPIIWWGVWVALFIGLSYLWVTGRKLRPATIMALVLAVVAYFINLLPFIGVPRVMFLYHYFFSWFYCLIFTVMLWNDLSGINDKHQPTRRQWYILGGVAVVMLLGFLYFSPLTYGTPLTQTGIQAHMWLRTWR
jgi:dolichyl-phosphate-mannose-protein mannosyltransferase